MTGHSSARRRVRGNSEMCIWPKCPETRSAKHPAIPLCGRHIVVVADQARLEREAEIEAARLITNKIRAGNGLEPVPPPRTQQWDGVIYYLLVGDRIKIGHAKDLERRLNAYPPNSVLLAHHEGSRADEAALHGRFSALRVAGREWYPADNDEILAHIAQIVRVHGEPSQDYFTKRQVQAKRQPVAMRSRSGGAYRRTA